MSLYARTLALIADIAATQKDTAMNDVELRLECLRLATVREWGDPVLVATAFFAFITGATALTPRQQIDTALDAANVS